MTDGLFENQTRRSFNYRIPLIAAAAFAVLFGGAYALYVAGKPKPPDPALVRAEEIRDSVVMMLAQTAFSGPEFETQILGRGKLEWYDRRERDAYFVYPPSEPREFDEFTGRFFKDPAKLEFGIEKDGKLVLGKLQAPISDRVSRFFRTKIENISIDPDQTVSFPFGNLDYTLSLEELKNLTNNSQIYGGRLLAGAEVREQKPIIVFANHGIMVSRPGEPSLKRLADKIVGTETDRERKIQLLTDFVSNEIEYSYTEAVGAGETLKRANETLMTRSADCSNKTILLASLLEQIGEEYLLLYCPKHITVAVPQGAFANDNKIDFTWNGKNWLIAETTLPGFRIGRTRVADYARLTKIEYVQSPKQSEIIFDADSYEVLKFF